MRSATDLGSAAEHRGDEGQATRGVRGATGLPLPLG